jgi:hypothetical protein
LSVSPLDLDNNRFNYNITDLESQNKNHRDQHDYHEPAHCTFEIDKLAKFYTIVDNLFVKTWQAVNANAKQSLIGDVDLLYEKLFEWFMHQQVTIINRLENYQAKKLDFNVMELHKYCEKESVAEEDCCMVLDYLLRETCMSVKSSKSRLSFFFLENFWINKFVEVKCR